MDKELKKELGIETEKDEKMFVECVEGVFDGFAKVLEASKEDDEKLYELWKTDKVAFEKEIVRFGVIAGVFDEEDYEPLCQAIDEEAAKAKKVED